MASHLKDHDSIYAGRHVFALSCLATVAAIIAYTAACIESRRAAIASAVLLEVPLGVCIYRLAFHPLARIPGPWLAAITDFYNVYHCLTGDRHIEFHRLHLKYGPVLRFGPNRVSFCTAEALNDIYSARANTQKSQVYTAFSHFFTVPASLTTIDRRTHRIKRGITSKALTPSAVRDFEGLLLKNVRLFISLLEDGKNLHSQHEPAASKVWSSPKDMSKLVLYLLTDIMGDVTFNKNWQMLEHEENRPLAKLLPVGTCGINLAGHIPALLKLKVESILFPKLMKGLDEFRSLSESQSSWRAAQDVKNLPQRDIFQALLEAKDPETGKSYTEKDLIAEAGILIVAGTDTTATALTASMFYLMHNPNCLRRARREVEFAFQDMALPDQPFDIEEVRIGERLHSCRFLAACIEEAIRMAPPIGAMLPREVLAGGIRIDGVFIPQGMDVGVPTFAIQHDATYHPDPYTFHPERWMAGEQWLDAETGTAHVTTADDVSRAQGAYNAFGWGRTNCIGRHLSYQEMMIVLARLLLLFDMRLAPGSTKGEGGPKLGWGRQRRSQFQLRDMFTSIHEGPEVQFRRRM